jgi:hypothetical protein
MGFFRFRRSVRLLPGVRWNFGKRSSSLSFGVRGAHYTMGTRGSRTTVGIPGTGLSYTQIHGSHSRVAGHRNWADIPAPSDEWFRANAPEIKFHFPDRRADEPPVTPGQLRDIQALGTMPAGFDWSSLGSDQADNLLAQMKEARGRFAKQLLRRYYRQQGASVPGWVVDHAVDHPGEPLPGTRRKGHGCLILVGILLLIGWIGSLLDRQGSPRPSSATPRSTPASSSTPAPRSVPASSTPIPPAAPKPPAAFPEARYWPAEVRISFPVELRGLVEGGTIRQTAKPGAVLEATLSPDHKTVTLRRLGITGTLPVEQTDFLERARKARAGE